MAKIGCMMLNNGRWQGTQIVSETWVRESITKQAPDCGNGYQYGYQWWLRSFKVRGEAIPCFLAKGSGGQCILVSPTLNMVIVFTGWNKSDLGPLLTLTERYILPAAS
jgi:CubicO group peptidase (beta-lactamase class C family)